MLNVKITLTFLFVLGFVTILGGCYGSPSGVIPRECRDFFELPASEREAKFRQYPVDKQVDLYLCGMNREPPASGYAAYIAEGGEQVIPYLLERLKREDSVVTQTRILDIFTVLGVKGHLRGRQDVIAEVEAIVSQMGNGPAAVKAHRYLEIIKQEANASRPSSEHQNAPS